MTPLYFEDVNAGDSAPDLVKGPITQQQLVRYSGASGDFNPIHTVPHIAEQVGLDGTIAHGMLIMAFAGQSLTDWAGADAVKQIKVRFTEMTKPGETLVCRVHVTKKNAEDMTVSGKLSVVSQSDASQKLKGTFTLSLPSKG